MEVEIEVHATGLGFGDVLIALGRYPGASQIPGYECIGNRIREAQRNLTHHEVGGGSDKSSEAKPDLTRFVASLSTAWRDGEVRPTHREQSTGPRSWRTRADPFENAWPLIEQWLNAQPDATAKALFQRLQAQTPTPFAPGQLRTLQRRVKEWRTAIARQLVLGVGVGDGTEVLAGECASEPGLT